MVFFGNLFDTGKYIVGAFIDDVKFDIKNSIDNFKAENFFNPSNTIASGPNFSNKEIFEKFFQKWDEIFQRDNFLYKSKITLNKNLSIDDSYYH